MKAAESGSMAVCIALLQMGADPFLVDNMNRRADVYAEITNPALQIHEMLRNYMQTCEDSFLQNQSTG